MENRKLIVKISYGLNAALIIVIVGLLVYQQHLIRQIADNERQAPPAAAISDSNTRTQDNTQTTPAAEGGMEQLAAEVDTLRYQLEASEEELDMAREDLADARDGQAPDISDLMAERKKMLENPSVRNMERRMAENMILENYGALFEMLGLPDAEIQAFKTLMVDFQMQMEEMSLDLMDQSLSEEERQEKMQLLGDQQETEFQKQAEDLLGAENYEKYETYKERITERWVATTFDPFGADDGLSDEKEQELIDAMYEARNKVEAEYGIDSSDQPARMGIFVRLNSEGRVDTEDLERQLKIYDQYIESAWRVLSESEAEQFETTIKGMKEMTSMAAENAPSLPGGGDDESQ